MARIKAPAKKKRLIKNMSQTKRAPFWTVLKIYGPKRRVHTGRHTQLKRNWRRRKTKS